MLHLHRGTLHLLPHSLEDSLEFFSAFSQNSGTGICDTRLERAGVNFGRRSQQGTGSTQLTTAMSSQQDTAAAAMSSTATRRKLYQAMNASLAGGLQLGMIILVFKAFYRDF